MNAAMLIIQALNFILLAVGAFWFYPRLIGTIINTICAFCAHPASWGAALGSALSTPGIYCSFNVAPSTYTGGFKGGMTGAELLGTGNSTLFGDWDEGTTYQSDQSRLLALGICQLLFWIPQCFCCWYPLYKTPRVSLPKPVA